MERKPTMANELKITSPGTVVIEYEGRTERVTSDGEQELTNGLIKVIQGKTHKVYFVQGHGEHAPDTSDRTGIQHHRHVAEERQLRNRLDRARRSRRRSGGRVGARDRRAQDDFFPAEVEMLKKYLAKGGKVMFLLDPPDRRRFGAADNLIALAKDWGIDVGTNIVVDVSGMGQLLGTGRVGARRRRSTRPIPITDRFNLLTAYPLADRSARLKGASTDTALRISSTRARTVGRRPTSNGSRRPARSSGGR
jgi:hypothetical protein